jgi:hypothetical protein
MSNRRSKKSDADQQLSNWSRRRVLSWSLFGLAFLVAGQHLLAHAGFRPLPLSMGWQDILVGYPTAGILAIIGALMLDPNPRI